MSEDFLKVSELNQFIKDVIEAGFPQALWVCGEIQGYNRNRDKKHIFFELVEKDPQSEEIKARIGLVIFSNRKSSIDNILNKSENAFSLKDDIEVKFLCKIDFYSPHGAVRLVVENIDPVYTLGKIAQERQKLITLLKQKGILDKNKQLTFPLVSLNIGLITSHDSAAYNDFLSELKKSGFGFKIYLRNTLMQGKNCPEDVCKALAELAKIDILDVVVITRGGGSIAELSCFDSQIIAERIASYNKPVLSGIGHEINTTITDLAAHTFSKTPTAIAQFLVERIKEYLLNLDEKAKSILELTDDILKNSKRNLIELAFGFRNNTMQFFKAHHERLIQIKQGIKERPVLLIKDSKRELIQQRDKFLKSVKLRLNNDKLKLGSYKKMIDIAHPINTMKRGFSITRNKQGKIIRNIADVKLKEEISAEVADGLIYADVRLTKERQG